MKTSRNIFKNSIHSFHSFLMWFYRMREKHSPWTPLVIIFIMLPLPLAWLSGGILGDSQNTIWLWVVLLLWMVLLYSFMSYSQILSALIKDNKKLKDEIKALRVHLKIGETMDFNASD